MSGPVLTFHILCFIPLRKKKKEITGHGCSGKDCVEEHDTDIRCCHSDIQLADGMTKKKMKMSCRMFVLPAQFEMETGPGPLRIHRLWKRAQMGMDPMDDPSTVGQEHHDGVHGAAPLDTKSWLQRRSISLRILDA